MKKQFILFCMMLVALAPVCFAQASPAKPAKSASNEKAITDLEKSAWESYKNKQADAFKKLMSQDYCGAYAEALKTLDVEVADMAKTKLRDYSLADMKVVFPSADVAGIRYKTTIQQTSEGKDMSGTYNSASVWVKKGGKWLEVFHTEVKAQENFAHPIALAAVFRLMVAGPTEWQHIGNQINAAMIFARKNLVKV